MVRDTSLIRVKNKTKKRLGRKAKKGDTFDSLINNLWKDQAERRKKKFKENAERLKKK